ncbi:hypothetical protein ACJX0J_017402 [Zea mays]
MCNMRNLPIVVSSIGLQLGNMENRFQNTGKEGNFDSATQIHLQTLINAPFQKALQAHHGQLDWQEILFMFGITSSYDRSKSQAAAINTNTCVMPTLGHIRSWVNSNPIF